MIIGTYAGAVFSIILLLSAISNLRTGKVYKAYFLTLLFLYPFAAYFAGLSTELIIFNFLTAFIVMAVTLVVSALLANAIPANMIYYIGSISPWIGSDQTLLKFLVATIFITALIVVITKQLPNSLAKAKASPIGLGVTISALTYSPFALIAMSTAGLI